MVMVLHHPTYEQVAQAAREGTAVVVQTASYASYVESTGTFELVDISNLERYLGGFRFNGKIVGMDIDAHPDDELRSVVFAKSGLAKVVVDGDGADIEFSINLTLCVV